MSRQATARRPARETEKLEARSVSLSGSTPAHPPPLPPPYPPFDVTLPSSLRGKLRHDVLIVSDDSTVLELKGFLKDAEIDRVAVKAFYHKEDAVDSVICALPIQPTTVVLFFDLAHCRLTRPTAFVLSIDLLSDILSSRRILKIAFDNSTQLCFTRSHDIDAQAFTTVELLTTELFGSSSNAEYGRIHRQAKKRTTYDDALQVKILQLLEKRGPSVWASDNRVSEDFLRFYRQDIVRTMNNYEELISYAMHAALELAVEKLLIPLPFYSTDVPYVYVCDRLASVKLAGFILQNAAAVAIRRTWLHDLGDTSCFQMAAAFGSMKEKTALVFCFDFETARRAANDQLLDVMSACIDSVLSNASIVKVMERRGHMNSKRLKAPIYEMHSKGKAHAALAASVYAVLGIQPRDPVRAFVDDNKHRRPLHPAVVKHFANDVRRCLLMYQRLELELEQRQVYDSDSDDSDENDNDNDNDEPRHDESVPDVLVIDSREGYEQLRALFFSTGPVTKVSLRMQRRNAHSSDVIFLSLGLPSLAVLLLDFYGIRQKQKHDSKLTHDLNAFVKDRILENSGVEKIVYYVAEKKWLNSAFHANIVNVCAVHDIRANSTAVQLRKLYAAIREKAEYSSQLKDELSDPKADPLFIQRPLPASVQQFIAQACRRFMLTFQYWDEHLREVNHVDVNEGEQASQEEGQEEGEDTQKRRNGKVEEKEEEEEEEKADGRNGKAKREDERGATQTFVQSPLSQSDTSRSEPGTPWKSPSRPAAAADLAAKVFAPPAASSSSSSSSSSSGDRALQKKDVAVAPDTPSAAAHSTAVQKPPQSTIHLHPIYQQAVGEREREGEGEGQGEERQTLVRQMPPTSSPSPLSSTTPTFPSSPSSTTAAASPSLSAPPHSVVASAVAPASSGIPVSDAIDQLVHSDFVSNMLSTSEGILALLKASIEFSLYWKPLQSHAQQASFRRILETLSSKILGNTLPPPPPPPVSTSPFPLANATPLSLPNPSVPSGLNQMYLHNHPIHPFTPSAPTAPSAIPVSSAAMDLNSQSYHTP